MVPINVLKRMSKKNKRKADKENSDLTEDNESTSKEGLLSESDVFKTRPKLTSSPVVGEGAVGGVSDDFRTPSNALQGSNYVEGGETEILE